MSSNKLIGGVIVAVLGVAFLTGGLIGKNMVDDQIDEALEEALIFHEDNPEHDEIDWAYNADEGEVPSYEIYYMWNMTNPAAVATGVAPAYEEIGPFTFRKYEQKVTIVYHENGSTSWGEQKQYVFQPSMSKQKTATTWLAAGAQLSLDMTTTNFNPGWSAILQSAMGYERALIASKVADGLDVIFTEANPLLITNAMGQGVAGAMADVLAGLIAGLGTQALALEQWANCSIVPDPGCGEYLEAGLLAFGGPLEISMTVAELLFNPTNPYALVNATTGGAAWYLASQGDAAALGAVQMANGLTPAQATQIATAYLAAMVPTIEAGVEAMMGLTTIEDIFLLQWATIGVVPGTAANPGLGSMDPTYQSCELAAYVNLLTGSPYAISLELARNITSPTIGLRNPDIAQGVVVSAMSSDIPTIQALLGLTDATLAGYIASYVCHVQDAFVLPEFILTLADLGTGLLPTRQVHDWLFNFVDGLIYDAAVDGGASPAEALAMANTGFFTNETTGEDIDTFNSGRDDLQMRGNHESWNGVTSVDIWGTVEEVYGTDATMFHPDVSTDDVLDCWSTDLYRQITWEYVEDIKVFEVDTYRFKLSDSVLAPDANYYQVVEGIGNMTAAAGVPIYLSKPHFLDADPAYEMADASVELHDLYLDIEPNTGAVIQGRKRLQMNLMTGPTDMTYPGVTAGIYQLLWVEQAGDITEDLAGDLKDVLDDLSSAETIGTTLLWGGPILGVLGILGGAALVVVAKKP